MKPNIELIKNSSIEDSENAVYYNYYIFPNIACRNWLRKTCPKIVFFGEFSLCRKCNQWFRYYWGNLNERFAYIITSCECSRCIHWWYNCGFYNKCIFHYIRIYQSTLFTTRVPRDIWCVSWICAGIFIVQTIVRYDADFVL